MFSPRDGAVRWIWNLPEGDTGKMLSMLRKAKAEGAGIRQSRDPGEEDLALCAVSAAWREISLCLPGYFDPRKELDKGRKVPARKRPADRAPEQRKRPVQQKCPAQAPCGSVQAGCDARTADLIAEMAFRGVKASV